MTVVRVKGFQIFDDRHGRRRCYHRRTRIAIDLVKYPIGSAEFLQPDRRAGKCDGTEARNARYAD
jgi:hypothetical protein